MLASRVFYIWFFLFLLLTGHGMGRFDDLFLQAGLIGFFLGYGWRKGWVIVPVEEEG